MTFFRIFLPIYMGLACGAASVVRIHVSPSLDDFAIALMAPFLMAIWPLVLLVAWLCGDLYTIDGKKL